MKLYLKNLRTGNSELILIEKLLIREFTQLDITRSGTRRRAFFCVI